MRIPAPDPTLTGSIRLRCELSAERLRGLPFGLPQQRAGSGYFVAYAPEPSERLDRGDLPTIDHGLTVAAATARVYAERSFKLPDDSRIEWTWLTPLPDYRVTTAATVTSRPTSHDERWAPPRPNGAYYGSSEANEYVRVLVENRRVAPTAEVNLGTGTVELAVPAGQVGVTLRQLEAMADEGVVAAFGMPARRSVWLLASFRPDSEWPEYIFDLRGWEPSANSNTYAVKKVSVDPGETVEVVIRSPQGE
ncbi:hypothetical protein [Botrimarina colliarenosi]|nr:hypothetical protein [Botrimarina colliarenosi]